MAKTDVVVLGAGIVGTSAALHLVKRGLSVALVDRRGPGEETSYGNTGIIGGAGVYPTGFPRSLSRLARIALQRAPEAHYHPLFLPRVAPWLVAYWRQSSPARLAKLARLMRPLMARSVAEHVALLSESGAMKYLRRDGWLSILRTDAGLAAKQAELALCAELGMTARVLDPDATRELEPSLNPAFRHAIYWTDVATLSNPLGVTRAYAERFTALGGAVVEGDARSLRRADAGWRIDTVWGALDAEQAVIALGPWSPDVLSPLGIKLPLAIKRGYHRHFRPRGNAALTRPLVDAENGFAMSPMEQGIRVTTGAEFADRDAPATPVQFNRVLPLATQLFPLGEPAEDEPWLGRRPMFPDTMPVIGRAPGQRGLWLDYGHGHLGLTLGPVSGRLLADMMTGATPFTDPAPYAAERFS
jgi:D-amino-acid dehydrogenase